MTSKCLSVQTYLSKMLQYELVKEFRSKVHFLFARLCLLVLPSVM